MDATITRDLRHEPGLAPLRLRRVEDENSLLLEHALLANRLAGWLAVQLSRAGAVLGEPLALREPRPGPAGRTVGLELALQHRATGALASLVVGPGLLRADEGVARTPRPDPGSPPGRLERALFLHRLLGLLAAVAEEEGPHLSLAARPAACARHTLSFDLHWGERAGAVEVGLDPSLLELCRGLPPPPVELAARPGCPRQVRVALELGRTALPYAELARLRPGDHLLLHAEHRRVEGRLLGPAQLCLAPGLTASGSLGPDHLAIEALAPPVHLHPETPSMTGTPLDDLRIDLHLRLGRLSLDLESLAALAPGVVLPLDLRSPEVELVVDEEILGRGELVELDDRLAVRLTARRR
ncbi:MAG: FliM/FliN family flagellar motor switch protein [Deltaproteobacteria bacterium]|nr:FliM/FliN family flagellar motor switch protein [Deltaproteobacteria bacterium]